MAGKLKNIESSGKNLINKVTEIAKSHNFGRKDKHLEQTYSYCMDTLLCKTPDSERKVTFLGGDSC